MSDPIGLYCNAEQLRRLALLHDPACTHMLPLVQLTNRIRSESGRKVPDFDPLDGGIDARLLILLADPGKLRGDDADKQALRTGFVSMNNPDLTASYINSVLSNAGITRDQVVIWNYTPWALDKKSRANDGEIEIIDQPFSALKRKCFHWLLDELKRLQFAILLGNEAHRAEKVLMASHRLTKQTIKHVCHPAHRAGKAFDDDVLAVFDEVSRLL